MKRNGSGRATLDEVASAAGVSRATVSRVVNGNRPVAPAIARAVRKAIDELGYVPNLMARSLMTKRTDLVTLVAGEGDVRVFTDPYFAAIIRGVAQELSDADIHFVLAMIQHPSDLERVQRHLLAGTSDGALVISAHANHNLLPPLLEAGVPVVLAGRPMDATLDVPYVDNDNLLGARLAARRLIDRGCVRVATIAGPADMSAGIDRREGFIAEVGAANDPVPVVHGDFTFAGGQAAAQRLLDIDPAIDGIFAASDLMALGALRALADAGRRVPEDVAVVGFDDIEQAALSSPPLTTVRQDSVQQGRTMAQLLLEVLGRADRLPRSTRQALAGKRSVMLPVELIRRGSA